VSRTVKDIMDGIEYTQKKKIANNTVRYTRPDGSVCIRLHKTDIVTSVKGDITLNSGGYKTPTTKDRMNNALRPMGWSVTQERKVWYLARIGEWDNKITFADGITIHADNTVTGAGVGPDRSLIMRIKKYAKGFAAALPVKPPDNGDCWGCLFHRSGNSSPYDMPMGTDHLILHFGGTKEQPEPYYVPSLLLRVLETRGIKPGQHAGSAYLGMAFSADWKTMLTTYQRQQFSRWISGFLYAVLIDGRKA
jgi:hypothetical protein